MDFREVGLADTWETLAAAGIAHSGTGVDRRRALKPAVLEAVGRRLAVFSISAAGCGLRDAEGVELWSAEERRAGVAHFELWDPRLREDFLLELAEAIDLARRAQRLTFVVVSVCWGANGPDGRALMGSEVPAAMREFAQGLVDVAGANVVHGHGTGGMLGVEIYRGAPILYSCGSLLEEEAARSSAAAQGVGGELPLRADLGYVARLVVRGSDALGWLELRPCTSPPFKAVNFIGRVRECGQ